MRNRFLVDPDISETGFGFIGFLHSIGETETGFAKLSKPGREMVSLTKPKMADVFTLKYLLSSSAKRPEITTKSNIHIFYKKYIKVL